MKIRYLGTCSGTEPMAGSHQCSLIMECAGINYWFDAGENCGYRAYTTPDIDVMNTKALFISHPHIDHIGGLPHLIFVMTKLAGRYQKEMIGGKLDIFVPAENILAGLDALLPTHIPLVGHDVSDGLLYEDENVTVTAAHNAHLGEDGSGGWHSYSYRLTHEGKRVVFSGDVASPAELDSLIEGGCDLLIMETGHHKVADVCSYALSRGIKKLRFNHHGREILGDRAACEAYVSDFAGQHGMDILIAFDGMVDIL